MHQSDEVVFSPSKLLHSRMRLWEAKISLHVCYPYSDFFTQADALINSSSSLVHFEFRVKKTLFRIITQTQWADASNFIPFH